MSDSVQTEPTDNNPTINDVAVGVDFDNDIVKQRDEGATLIKVYVTPQEHERLRKLCANRGGMSNVMRKVVIKWSESIRE